MNSKTIQLPFFEIILTGGFSQIERFFSDQFFTIKDETAVLAQIYLNCGNVELPENLTILEGNTFFDGSFCYLLDAKGKAIRFKTDEITNQKITLTVDPNFDTYYLYHYLLEPFQVIWAANNGLSFVHASGLSNDEKGLLFPAWRNTGKTNIMLSAISSDFGFLGDDYCIIKDDTIFPYPKKINLFSYNIAEYPELLDKLPLKQKIQIHIGMLAKSLLKKLGRFLQGSIAKILIRLSELAEVATNFKLNPSTLSSFKVKPTPLKKVVLLQRASSIGNGQKLSSKQLQDKLVQIITYELAEFMLLYKKIIFLSEGPWKNVESFEANYRKALQQNISIPSTKIEVNQSIKISAIETEE